MLVPGSHRLAAAAAARLALDPVHQQTELKEEILRLAAIDTARGIEIGGREGDLLVFDPFCLHSGSANVAARPRHVMFQSYYDASATDLDAGLEAIAYRSHVAPDLREHLPPRLRSLLDR
jgi:hypothetical protein